MARKMREVNFFTGTVTVIRYVPCEIVLRYLTGQAVLPKNVSRPAVTKPGSLNVVRQSSFFR